MTGFTLPPDIAEIFRQLGDHVRDAPPSEALAAFALFARKVAGLVGPRLPRVEAAGRLQTFAEAVGLVMSHGVDAVQAKLSESFECPIFPDPDLDQLEPLAPEFSDESLALRFARENSATLRYVASQGRWYGNTGTHWRMDDVRRVQHIGRGVTRSAANACGNKKAAAAIASAKTVTGMMRLASSDPRLACRVTDFDRDPWTLNTPAGVIDLHSGKMRLHEATDLLTKITAVSPDPSRPIPVWLQFLTKVMKGDNDLIDFLQKVVGYALTGLIREHALFFLYGTGANGKSTFLNVITGCLGTYHRTAAIETFTASAVDRHPTDLAALWGARMVTSVETEEGRRWDESRIKSLTGGDRIAARFMRQDYFEFAAIFKLLIAGNHRPSLRSVDEAIRRRFHMLPFVVTIPTAERDDKLGEKLQAEWPGILAWAIEGCALWQRVGLAPPAAVIAATASYLDAEDTLASWIAEAGEHDAEAFETTTALFQAWRKHATRSGEYVGSTKKFSQRLEERGEAIGLEKGRDSRGHRGFFGLRLATLAPSEDTP